MRACIHSPFAFVALLGATVAFAQGPRIDAIDPATGPIAGGTVVTISGSGFSGATVTLDQKPMTPASLTDTTIQLTTPPHDNGYALLKASTAAGAAYAEFLYVPPRLKDLPPGYITTVAGVGDYLRFHLPANTASIGAVGIAVDAKGNILFGWPPQNRILEVRKDGTLEPFAGNGNAVLDNGDGGPAVAAWIGQCRTVSLDAAGNAYIPDDAQNRIRRVDAATGIISTIAGTGVAGFSGDGGPAKGAQINQPNYLAADADGTLYFGDHGNARIRKISNTGTISTIAGTGVVGDSGDGGPATAAQLDMPQPGGDADVIALDRARQLLYLSEYFAGKIRRIDLRSGIITTFFAGDPPAVPLVHPWPLAVDSASNLYVGTEGQIIKLDPEGRVLHRWGTVYGYSDDGTPLDELLVGQPSGLAVEADGNILFSDVLVQRLRRMNFGTGKLETVAGIAPRAFGVPGPANAAVLIGPWGDLAFLPSGDLLFGGTGDLRIFRIDPAGQITVFGGTGMYWSPRPGGDGRPVSDTVIAPFALEADAYGGLYTSDGAEIDYIDPAGIFHRLTQASPVGYAGDGGPAREALLTQPLDVALDPQGNVFIADTNNNRIRRIDAKTGIITTVAGTGPSNGFENWGHGTYCGDGGPAVDACLNTPWALAVEPDGTIYIADSENGRLRKIDPGGVISTFQNVPKGYGARMLADGYGGLFLPISVTLAHLLPDGTFWAVAGNGERGFSGDGGPARQARISGSYPARDEEGNLFFWDVGNHRIRAVRFGAVLAPPGSVAMASGGTPQTVELSRPLATPLEVLLRDASGHPLPGVRVDFAAPSSGPSCAFPGGVTTASALTDRVGRTSLSCTAGCAPGAFEVTATPLVTFGQPVQPARFAITATGENPAPVADSVEPAAAAVGRSDLVVKVRGRDLSPCSMVRWNGAGRPTRFVSTGEVEVTLPATDFAHALVARLTVATPPPGGGESSSLEFRVGGRVRRHIPSSTPRPSIRGHGPS